VYVLGEIVDSGILCYCGSKLWL